MQFPRSNILSALIAIGVVLIMSASVVAISALPNDEPERIAAPDTTERERRNCSDRHDLPEGVSCARVAKDYEFAAAVHYVEQTAFVAFTEAAWQAELVRQAAAQRSSGPAYSGGATGECGGATNGADAFIARESGGSSTVWNAQGSSAWGCYQIIDSTWASSCSDLGTHGQASAAAQAECASRLPLSAWASSGPTG